MVAGGATSFIAPTRFVFRWSRQASLRQDETVCSVLHQDASRSAPIADVGTTRTAV